MKVMISLLSSPDSELVMLVLEFSDLVLQRVSNVCIYHNFDTIIIHVIIEC